MAVSAACRCCVAVPSASCDCAAWVSISRRVPASSLASAAARACASSSARRCCSALAVIAWRAAPTSCVRAPVFFCSCCRDSRNSAAAASAAASAAGFIVGLSRLRGLGLDLTVCSRKLACERRGARPRLVKRATSPLGARRHRPARRADLLLRGGGLSSAAAAGYPVKRSGRLRRPLLLYGLIDSLPPLRGPVSISRRVPASSLASAAAPPASSSARRCCSALSVIAWRAAPTSGWGRRFSFARAQDSPYSQWRPPPSASAAQPRRQPSATARPGFRSRGVFRQVARQRRGTSPFLQKGLP